MKETDSIQEQVDYQIFLSFTCRGLEEIRDSDRVSKAGNAKFLLMKTTTLTNASPRNYDSLFFFRNKFFLLEYSISFLKPIVYNCDQLNWPKGAVDTIF